MFFTPLALDRLRRLVFAAGLLLSLLLLARGQVGGDQLNLLARGWLLAERGILVPYGNPLSNEGKEPGPLTSLLVGLPLLLWRDARAAATVVWLAHLGAYLVLDRLVKRALGPRERLLLAVFYWLNPWRLYFSGFLWNPNYLFLLGAVHLGTAFGLRRRPRFWPSLLHMLALGVAFQLHASCVILVLASALLLWRRYFRLHWGGALAGAGLAVAALVPWVIAAASDPAILPGHKGFPLRGLLLVFPLLRGVLYWLRYGSLHLSGNLVQLDFSRLLGSEADAALQAIGGFFARAVAPLTVLLPLAANWRLARRARPLLARRFAAAGADRVWLRGYVVWTFLGAVVAFCLAPTTVMMWQGFIVLHAAVLPVVFWLGALARSRRAAWARRITLAWLAGVLFLGLLTAFGSPHYRCGGKEVMGMGVVLRGVHPMLHDLGVARRCPPPTDAQGWWPDVLPTD
jgi:hypothetical protein